ncbi:hypothetical protein O9992_10140 [Vibrio lentus]|nr:hypothetical protein [Vibrio lentus]
MIFLTVTKPSIVERILVMLLQFIFPTYLWRDLLSLI